MNIATLNILLVSRDTEHANTAETDEAIKTKRVLKCCEPDDEVPRARNPGAKAYMHRVSQGNRSHRSSTAIHKEVVRDMKECFKKPDCTGLTYKIAPKRLVLGSASRSPAARKCTYVSN